MKKQWETFSSEETEAIGEKMGQATKPAQIYSLDGDLGVGKTVFTKGFARGLGVTEHVTSPTFTIINEYLGRIPLYHFDVYRISSEEEMDDIGYEDYFYGHGVSLVEWATLIPNLIPKDAIHITIEKDFEKGDDYRRITVCQGEEA
ncbi:tRNA threonylcarbamoyladenosine biosynthesis protein TsaE [bioreactor metagenome]|uniref:tRNA threonylcarbamoyladenosine biosynthesis protein TsaE n=1 Tax=bioreactor metagenome TaxID=1076179 RepID=A0A645F3X9_9ZZZZ|nr:tRNA (adenosine(37)-N6)-threonylcarbamoyltransferase complex ATPase subunit type 1 TsaE [Anaerotignum propionicum]MEA5056283.1 tRNA (adenosine(37)-N6)-threonylcarbamoyltransferase complex ATPase subunit type 1 TsaE [Anaerotignum propionicum]